MMQPVVTAHTALEVKQLSEHTWMAACSCGEYWDAESAKAANHLRKKHIRACAVQARKTKGGAA